MSPPATAQTSPRGTHGRRGRRLSLPGDADHAHAHAQDRHPRAGREPFDLDHLTEEILARLEQLPPLPSPGRCRARSTLNHPLWVTDRRVDRAPRVRPRRARTGRDEGPGGADRQRGRHPARPHPPAVGDARVPAVRRRPDRGDHQDAPRARRRGGRQRAAGQPRRRPGATHGRRATGRGSTSPSSRRRPGSSRRGWPWSTRSRRSAACPVCWPARSGRSPRLVARSASRTCTVPRPLLDVPRMLFNGALTARRNFATCTLSMAEIKEVQRAHGVTMNDVVLAVVGGALRRWLLAREAADRLPGGRRARGHRPARRAAAARRQPGLEHVHLAGHRHRGPARAAAQHLPDDRGVQDRPAHAGAGHARGLGAVRPAGSAERGDAALLPLAGRVPAPAAVQPGGLQRPGPRGGDLDLRRAATRPVQRRTDP